MLRKLLISIAALALTITLKPIPTTAQVRNGQQPSRASQAASSQAGGQPAQGANQNQPTANQGGESGTSVVVTVNQPPTEPRQAEPRPNTANNDGGGGGLANWFIVALTAVIALVGILQWLSIKRQADAMDGQLAAMRAQLTTADENTAINRRSTDLTYQALNMTHRARLTVRNVTIDLAFATSIKDGKAWVTNTGYGPAMILKAYATWIIEDRLPMENPALAAIVGEHPIDKTLNSGEILQLDLPTTAEMDLSEYRALHERGTGTKSIYLVGVVKYRDNLTHLRRTFFCRRFDPQLQRFVKVDDPDYEYEE